MGTHGGGQNPFGRITITEGTLIAAGQTLADGR